MLLCQLSQGETNVGSLETLTGIRQPTLSQQLGVLRREGLVNTRREGKQIYYSLQHAPAAMLLETLYGLYCGQRCPAHSTEDTHESFPSLAHR